MESKQNKMNKQENELMVVEGGGWEVGKLKYAHAVTTGVSDWRIYEIALLFL